MSRWMKGTIGGLSLRLKPGEHVMLGPDILLEITDIQGKNVRINFKVPKELPINRVRDGICLQKRKQDETI